MLNVSTRGYVQTGENVLIGGVIITGSTPKKVIMRAIGPSLTAAGLKGALQDPTLTVYDSSGNAVASNDNWKTSYSAVQATGLAPSNDLESAIVTTLAPGTYTAIVSGVGGGKGIALFELYDCDPTSSRVGNISTRGRIETGDNIMIGGFIIGGNQPTQVVVRAIGPSLAASHIEGALADPTLELYNSSGSRIFANDNWRSEQAQQLIDSSLAPSDEHESAIIATLQPGSYTAIVRGAHGTMGVALVEVYNVSPQ